MPAPPCTSNFPHGHFLLTRTFVMSDTVNRCHLHRLISEDYFSAYHGQKNFCLVDLKGRNLQ